MDSHILELGRTSREGFWVIKMSFGRPKMHMKQQSWFKCKWRKGHAAAPKCGCRCSWNPVRNAIFPFWICKSDKHKSCSLCLIFHLQLTSLNLKVCKKCYAYSPKMCQRRNDDTYKTLWGNLGPFFELDLDKTQNIKVVALYISFPMEVASYHLDQYSIVYAKNHNHYHNFHIISALEPSLRPKIALLSRCL